jgi:hypothetical protein
VVRKEFGVSYHPAHVSRLLQAPRQSLQKPQHLSEQRPCFRTWTSPLRSSVKLNSRFTAFSEVCAFFRVVYFVTLRVKPVLELGIFASSAGGLRLLSKNTSRE